MVLDRGEGSGGEDGKGWYVRVISTDMDLKAVCIVRDDDDLACSQQGQAMMVLEGGWKKLKGNLSIIADSYSY